MKLKYDAFKNILIKFFIFIKIKKNWRRPKKAKIIIYDHLFYFYFEKYLKDKEYVIYHNRIQSDSEINVFIILECLINFDFKFKTYRKRFFSYVNPKIVITMFDNNPTFYKLKSEFPQLTTIAVQKAWKYDVEFDIIYDRHKKKDLGYQCDYLFCYNKFIAEIYSKFIKTKKIFLIGSFLSNFEEPSNEKKDYIIYISQWRNYNKSEKFHKNLNIGDWQKNEKIFLEKLISFVEKNSFNLKVLGKTKLHTKKEKIYYDEIFGKNYEFIYQSEKRENYKILDAAKLTVSLDSTLAYENLARGNKTVFFSIRNDEKLDFDMIRFCWPERKNETGPNWTNSLSNAEFSRLFSVIDLNEIKWRETCKKYFEDTLIFDLNNSQFSKLLEEIN